jgi:hypothetical protein
MEKTVNIEATLSHKNNQGEKFYNLSDGEKTFTMSYSAIRKSGYDISTNGNLVKTEKAVYKGEIWELLEFDNDQAVLKKGNFTKIVDERDVKTLSLFDKLAML